MQSGERATKKGTLSPFGISRRRIISSDCFSLLPTEIVELVSNSVSVFLFFISIKSMIILDEISHAASSELKRLKVSEILTLC